LSALIIMQTSWTKSPWGTAPNNYRLILNPRGAD
jgi:hypothetical protein